MFYDLMTDEKYNETIDMMENAYREALENPHVEVRVCINPETGKLEFRYATPGSNEWYEHLDIICEYCFDTCPPYDQEERSYEEVWKEEFLPYLVEKEELEAVEEYKKDPWNEFDENADWCYRELINFIEDKFSKLRLWDNYVDRLIDGIIDCTDNDFFTDCLDAAIEEDKEYHRQNRDWWDWKD